MLLGTDMITVEDVTIVYYTLLDELLGRMEYNMSPSRVIDVKEGRAVISPSCEARFNYKPGSGPCYVKQHIGMFVIWCDETTGA